ncbi:MAG: ISKra4 family transposase, partial [Planctomycetia bacterium]|nr:ISKra4 family transposase [Planctomycetia bacterium]
LLPRASGLRLAESTVERATEAAGVRLGEALAAGQTFGAAADRGWPLDAAGRPVASVSVDATGVPIQGPGGGEAEGRMAWVGKVFAPRPEAKHVTDDTATGARRPAATGHARYPAGLMGLDDLGDPPRRQAAQVGMDRAEQWVALSDCGSGVDDVLRVNSPRAVRIADSYHVAEHLGDPARAWHPGAPDAARGLSDGWCHTLKHEGGRATLEALDRGGRSGPALEVHRQVTQYLGDHADRMDDPAYVKAGWQIGSGHIEAACKTAVNERLKRSGMRWGEGGADAVCHLRALFKGDAAQ